MVAQQSFSRSLLFYDYELRRCAQTVFGIINCSKAQRLVFRRIAFRLLAEFGAGDTSLKDHLRFARPPSDEVDLLTNCELLDNPPYGSIYLRDYHLFRVAGALPEQL
ncbi:hypothetical protein KIN20_028319 [Parelaphostrongylus tenuis]|uniref:Uncharacterized protein n=1 Tax=Parelaphostrongylus tenuis TaxID=148309 RepID=A0AAD5R0P4_PARTN|nr:hypothetical protein KIN20_028319 [Parelaphostrongylus tenuis]